MKNYPFYFGVAQEATFHQFIHKFVTGSFRNVTDVVLWEWSSSLNSLNINYQQNSSPFSVTSQKESPNWIKCVESNLIFKSSKLESILSFLGCSLLDTCMHVIIYTKTLSSSSPKMKLSTLHVKNPIVEDIFHEYSQSSRPKIKPSISFMEFEL